MPRCPNRRRVRTHFSYTAAELAKLLDVHLNTVRAWQKAGLEPIPNTRPLLFKGAVLIAFLTDRRQSRKVPLKPGEIYCLPCGGAREPAGGVADYRGSNSGAGMLEGVCPTCQRMMYRRVAERDLACLPATLAVQFHRADSTLRDTASARVNSDIQTIQVKP